jgi:hypothetical protein
MRQTRREFPPAGAAYNKSLAFSGRTRTACRRRADESRRIPQDASYSLLWGMETTESIRTYLDGKAYGSHPREAKALWGVSALPDAEFSRQAAYAGQICASFVFERYYMEIIPRLSMKTLSEHGCPQNIVTI